MWQRLAHGLLIAWMLWHQVAWQECRLWNEGAQVQCGWYADRDDARGTDLATLAPWQELQTFEDQSTCQGALFHQRETAHAGLIRTPPLQTEGRAVWREQIARTLCLPAGTHPRD